MIVRAHMLMTSVTTNSSKAISTNALVSNSVGDSANCVAMMLEVEDELAELELVSICDLISRPTRDELFGSGTVHGRLFFSSRSARC